MFRLSAPVIKDARTGKESEEKIQEGIVQGVLRETGLPPLSQVIQGVGKSVFPNPGESAGDKGAKPAVFKQPASEHQKTPQKLGTMRYMGSQKKGS